MAPTLTAPTVSNYLTGAWWNANVHDMLNYGLTLPLMVCTQGAATQSVNNNAWTGISLDTEQADTYGGHSTTVNTSRFTAAVAGWYTVCGVTVWAANATGVRGARIQVNGSVIQGSTGLIATATTGSFTGVATPVRSVQLAAGDYLEVAGYQSSGGALSTGIAGDLASALFVVWAHT